MSLAEKLHRLRAIKRLFLVAVVVLGLGAMSTTATAANRYDVSYFWSKSLARVQAYRDRVAVVLGPEVARGLKVVAEGDLYGLVYGRYGGRTGAIRVANVHSRLLRSRGLESAVAVRSQDWEMLDGGEARQASFAPVGMPQVSRDEMTETGRSREIPDLQSSVEGYISRLRREGKIKDDERTAWSVYDFTSGEKLVSINEDDQFEAASMVKLFIAAAFFHKAEQGS